MNNALVEPTQPLLASQLINDAELDDLLEGVCIDNNSSSSHTYESGNKERLSTGLKNIDGALAGGIKSGSILEVSGEAGADVSDICRTLLVTSLLQYGDSSAAVVDTTGNFDVLRLYALIIARLGREQSHILASLREQVGGGSSSSSVEDVAARLLDRVKIMRVFDFEGVREAVAEIGSEVDGQTEVQKEEVPSVEEEEVEVDVGEKPKRTFVPDSEDEEDEEDEMLFESEANAAAAVPKAQEAETKTVSSLVENTGEGSNKGKPTRLKFIFIDNLSHVIDPLLRNDTVQATSQATTFLSHLTHLTKTHALHTILANPATTPRLSTSPTRNSALLRPVNTYTTTTTISQSTHQIQQQQQQQKQAETPHISIFSSTRALPHLPNLLGTYTDVRMLVSKVPLKRGDARLFYNSNRDSAGGIPARKKVEMGCVVEVVRVRDMDVFAGSGGKGGGEGGEGEWSGFVVGRDGILTEI